MAIVNGYLTAAEAKAYLGMNATPTVAVEGLLDDVITAVSREIDGYCDREFFPVGTSLAPVARVFEPPLDAEDELLIGDLVECAAIEVDDGSGEFATAWADGTEFELRRPDGAGDGVPFSKVVLLGDAWPTSSTRRRRIIRVSGVWNWAAAPPQVKEACRIQVARRMNRPKSPLGLAGGVGEFGAMRVFGAGWDQDALSLLSDVRRRRFGIA